MLFLGPALGYLTAQFDCKFLKNVTSPPPCPVLYIDWCMIFKLKDSKFVGTLKYSFVFVNESCCLCTCSTESYFF